MNKKLFIVLSILLISTLAISAQFIQLRKLGGFNTRTNPYELQDYEASDISNFTLDKAGSITERDLFKKYNITSIGSITLTNIYKFYKTSDTGYMICSGGSNLYKATAGVLTDISVSSSSVIANSQWSFETFTDGTNELVFGANNNIPLKSWNGSSATFTEEDGQPGTYCNILKKHKSRLWASGSKTYPYRIYYSSLTNGDDWNTSGGSMDLPDYEKIMSLETLGDILYVLTRQSIYAVVGDVPNEFYILKTSSKVGTHAFKSVTLGGRLIFFLNKAGVFAFDGTESVNITETIQPTIDLISDTYIGDAAGLYDKRGRYLLSYTSSTGSFNDTILVYDTVVKQWYKFDNVNFSSFFKAEGGTDKGELYAGCSNPIGYLWQLQDTSILEQITHSTYDQLNSGVTFNTVVTDTPTVELLGGNDNYTKLLVHFNGVDGATTYTTEDYGKRVVYFGGDTALDTAYKKFGLSSALLPATFSSYINVPSSTDWDFEGNDFTLETWVRFNVLQSTYLFSTLNPNGWGLYYNNTNKELALYSSYLISTQSGAGTFIPTTGTWYHIAVVRNGTDLKYYVNGTQIGTTQVAAALYNSNANTLFFGYEQFDAGYYLNGWLDELRISKDRARWTTNFTIPATEYTRPTHSGNLTSSNLQINASGQLSLGMITWNENLPTNTDIQFTTRTGVTNDSVYYNGWQSWVTTNVVSLNTVTNPTVWSAQDATVFTAIAPLNPQPRNILFYETDDNVSPSCVQFDVSRGSVSMNKFADCTVPIVNLSNDKFIGYWLKSPVTGNSVRLDIGEVTGTSVAYITSNTVQANTWEYHYWALNNPSTDIDNIGWMRITYLGDMQGKLYLGAMYAYDFFDNGDTITSTPNDWIQYKAILGSNNYGNTPQLIKSNNFVITLSYTSTSGETETSLTSTWKSKVFDFGQPNYNKKVDWVEITGLCNNPTTHNSVTLNYELDGGNRSGSVVGYFNVTGSTTKVRFYLPNVACKDFLFELEDTDVDNDLRIDNVTISYFLEAGDR